MEGNDSCCEMTSPPTAVSIGLLSFCAMVLMTMLMTLTPIYFAAFQSTVDSEDQKESEKEKKQPMTIGQALQIPFISSCFLCFIHCLYKIFPRSYVNLALSSPLIYIETLELSRILRALANKVVPSYVVLCQRLHLPVINGNPSGDRDRTDLIDLLCTVCSIAVAIWFLETKHWIARDLLTMSYSVFAISLLQSNDPTNSNANPLCDLKTGCVLLAGFVVYDVFWVFCTDVMQNVVSLVDEVPITLLIPADLFESDPKSRVFMILGLGDIILPGIFIALLLKFDVSLRRNELIYFYTGLLGYVYGLMITFVCLLLFKRLQPALLYLVPACVGFPLMVAIDTGELGLMFRSDKEVQPTVRRQCYTIPEEEEDKIASYSHPSIQTVPLQTNEERES